MKQLKRILTGLLALVLAVSLCAPALAEGLGTTVYSSTAQLAQGLSRVTAISWHETLGREAAWATVYELGADVRPIVVWGDQLKAGDTVLEAAQWAESRGLTVLAGVNSDFFDMASGSPMGVAISGGKLYSTDAGSNAVGFAPDGATVIGCPGITLDLTNLGGGADASRAGLTFAADHYNKQPGPWVFDLLSRDYAPTLHLSGSWTIAELGVSGEMVLGTSLELTVEHIFALSDCDYTIPEGKMIFIAQTDGYAVWKFGYFSLGDVLRLDLNCADSRFYGVTEACGGGDILVSGGAITDFAAWNSSVADTNPRTAVGVRPDGSLVFYTVDGRIADHSAGLTLYGLAEAMLAQGCTTALNLDGGGSTALVTRTVGQEEAAVTNVPNVSSLRRCAVYILLVTDRPADGVPAHLSLTADGGLVLTGSALPLGEVMASDGGYQPVAAPADTQVAVLSGPAAVEDGVLQAGQTSGGVVLGLTSDQTGAVGTANVHVLGDVTGVKLSVPLVGEGDSVQLAPTASYWGLPVAADPASFTYAASGGCTVDETGLMTAAPLAGSEENTVTAGYGSASATTGVSVYCRFADTEAHWAAADIEALSKAGVAKGTILDGARYFQPDTTITRQELFTMLARVLALDTADYADVELPFADCAAIGSWALPSVQALYALGYVTGSSVDGELYANPAAPVSRQEVCTILARVLNVSSNEACLTGFSDAGQLAAWAREGMAALIDLGMVSGYADGTLRPGENTTRAQIAKLLRPMTGL